MGRWGGLGWLGWDGMVGVDDELWTVVHHF